MKPGLFFTVMWLCCAHPAWAHGGGTNADGCHTNRKTGDYHCHGARHAAAPSSGGQAPSAARPFAPPPGAAAACHVGPRGGTYTITPSGRKNYAGC